MKPISQKALDIKRKLKNTVENHQNYIWPKDYIDDIRELTNQLEEEIVKNLIV